MRTLKKFKSISLKMLIWMASISLSIISGNAYASVIQAQSPATIFAASCATCHGGQGLGGVSFVKNGPTDDRVAPKVAGKPLAFIISMVRNGSNNGAMPAFGPEEITNAELQALAIWLRSYTSGVPAHTAPAGSEVRLDILDADPWYSDHGVDNALDPGDDIRRVALGANNYLKVVNTGRTWHTFTDSKNGKDSGFIGYAGNYDDAVGDLYQGQPGGIGYYYADQTTGLTAGCHRYLCKLHPYMQVEVCTDGYLPSAPTAALGLTRAHKHALGTPAVAGVGAVWVTAQSQEEATETGTGTVSANSVTDMDGAYQVIDAADWSVDYIANVGNNPHNAWPGKRTNIVNGNPVLSDVVLSANWHDNTVTLMNANSPYNILGEKRSGAATAHIQVSPGASERFYVTHMGGAALQEIDVNKLALGQDPNIGGTINGATAPHGLWFCGDGIHVMTADTLGHSATLYNINLHTSVTAPSGGKAPLAPALFSGVGDGCSRGFTNNALTADVSVYNINSTAGAEGIVRNTAWTANSANGLYKNAAGNIQLRNTTDDQVTGGAFQARSVHLPVQTPVSPADATTHGRFMVTANKASFNVSVTALNSVSGDPVATYTFPAGLGAHGVTYGRKSSCDGDNDGVEALNDIGDPSGICYYAYVTNTFEDYVSVYDLEKIDINDDGIDNNILIPDTNVSDPSGATAGVLCFDDPLDTDLNGDLLCNGAGMQGPGSAILAETVYVEGGAVAAVVALDPTVAELCDAAGQGDPLGDLDANGIDSGAGPLGDILDCGVGPTGGLYVSNLPIGVLCPDCRSGVHVGDIPLTRTAGQEALAYDVTAVLASDGDLGYTGGGNGGTSKYTYLKEDVYVDTETVTCTLAALYPAAFTGLPGGGYGGLNDCDGNVPVGMTGRNTGTDAAGKINTYVELDLHLGINTGGQGIVASPAATPWP